MYAGIDPGIRKGKCVLAVLGPQPRFVQLGSNKTKQAKGVVSDYVRSDEILVGLLDALRVDSDSPGRGSVIAVEGPSLARKGFGSVQLGMLHHAIYRALASFRGLVVVTVPPLNLKQFVMGKGKASKEQMVAKIQDRWLRGRDLVYCTEDMYEAYALAEVAKAMDCPPSSRPASMAGKVLVHRVRRGRTYYAIQ